MPSLQKLGADLGAEQTSFLPCMPLGREEAELVNVALIPVAASSVLNLTGGSGE